MCFLYSYSTSENDSMCWKNQCFKYVTYLLVRETYVERLKGETPNDYNDRSIRQATK